MPRYDYRCQNCRHQFETRHSMNDDPPPCPECDSGDLQRLITSAPIVARGMLTHAGDGFRASKEQLRDKWSDETPRLRQRLVDKLGEDKVNQMAPTLNTSYDD